MIAFVRAFDLPNVKRNIFVCGAQMSKTEAELDVIGERLDNRPVPILFVGPSKEFNTDQFEPRLEELFTQAKELGKKVLGGIGSKKQKKTLKRVAGVRVRLAHAGSSTALKSDPAALALVDEYDEMLANVRGQGDPLGLVEARGFTYPGFVTGITSTCSKGVVGSSIDEATGLEFWDLADTETLESPIWSLWQQGTRFHWVWNCPKCGTDFVPRSKLLRWPDWPKVISPSKARRSTWIECPHCDAELRDDVEGETKGKLNRAGSYVAPNGSRIRCTAEGELEFTGPAIENDAISFWVSGLASPFVTWGDRVGDWLQALASGETDKVQTAVNAGFGELYAAGSGEVPEWQEVKAHALPYKPRTIPVGVRYLTAGIDVQKLSLVFVIRGWGARGESWLIDAGQIWGETAELEVWNDLAELLTDRYGGHTIRRAMIDAGFRPGKKDQVPEHRVYDFCRRFQRFVSPAKGYATLKTPIIKSKIEVESTGKAAKYGLELMRLNSDYFKTFVHDRLRWPLDQPGAWHLHEEVTDDYCQQIVSEARTVKPNGQPEWVRRARDNHFLDAEALASAGGYLLGAQRLSDRRRGRPEAPAEPNEEAPAAKEAAPAKEEPASSSGSSRRDRFRSFARRFNN